MANTVAKQTILDGPRNAVIKVFLASDGAAGELTDEVVVDVSALYGAPAKVHLTRVMHAFRGFDALLEWDATTDKGIMTLTPESGVSEADFRDFGGIPNDAGTGVTGDILLTTTGFTASGDTGWLLLEVVKD